MKKMLSILLLLPVIMLLFSCEKEQGLPEIGTNEAGVTYYVKANRTPEQKAYLQLAVKAGSCNEAEDQRGLAHFIEHMAFNGTQSYEGKELVAFLESMGVAFGPELNAYTSYNETVYELEVPTAKPELLNEAINILQEWAFSVTLAEDQIEKERGIIAEEKRLRNTASYRSFRKMTAALFGDSLYTAREPIGTDIVIKTAPRQRLVDFYRSWYRPENMAVFVVGDIDEAAVVTRLQSFAPQPAAPQSAQPLTETATAGKTAAASAANGGADLPNPAADGEAPALPHPDLTVPFDGKRRITAFADPELTAAAFTVWHKYESRPLINEEDYRLNLIYRLAATVFSQTVQDMILSGESDLISFSAYTGSYVRTLSVFGAEMSLPENRIEKALTQFISVAKGFRSGLCDNAKLERAKQALLTEADAAEANIPTYESLAYLNWYKDDWLNGHKTVSVASYVDRIRRIVPSVTLSELNGAFAELLADADTVFSLSAPSLPFPTDDAEILIGRLLDETEPVMPASAGSETLFFPYEPKQGTITDKQYFKEVESYRYTLSNGVTVWARPSSYKKDYVEMSALQNGGLSLASKAEYTSALLTSDWLNRGGLGAMNASELKAYLETRNASCSVSIDNLTHGFNGYSAAKDLETLFQMIYLYLMQPNPDETSFRTVQKAAVENAEKRANDPTETFFLRVNERLHNGNFRYLPPTADELREADSETSLAFYRRLFGGRGFTFIFAGDFKPKTLENYLTRYLASIEFERDPLRYDLSVYAPIPTEAMADTVLKGSEPKSIVQILFVNDEPFSIEASEEASALGSVIDMMLRDQIREESSGAYATQGYAYLSRLPFEQSLTAAAFFCDPQRVEELLEQTRTELKALSEGTLNLNYLKNHIEIEKNNLKAARQTNSYWREQLIRHIQGTVTLADIAGREDALTAVTPERIKAAAARWLRSEKMKIFILKPETDAGSSD